jgi:hypothetical protein
MAEPAEQRRTVATACISGMSAIVFVTDPSRWPAFAAFAEQHTPESWTERDRRRMRAEARVLREFAGLLDAAGEGQGNG